MSPGIFFSFEGNFPVLQTTDVQNKGGGGDAFSVVSQTFLGWAIGGKLLTFWVASLVK